MKKTFALMAFATALTASASVSQVVKNPTPAEKMDVAPQILEYSAVENESGMRKAPAQPIFNNYYGLTYVGMTSQDNNVTYSAIELKKESDTKVIIYGLFCPVSEAAVEATYNASNQTLTIKPQVVIPAAEWVEISGKNEDLRLYCHQLEVDENDKITNDIEVNSITFTYAPNGVKLSDGSVVYEGGWVPENSLQELVFNVPSNLSGTSGWLGSWKYNLAIFPLEDTYPLAPAFTFNESEWTSIGNAKFSDGWLAALLDDQTPYDVPAYVNKANSNLYVLRNPYGAQSPYAQYNESLDVEGYIVLDVTNPDCVLVRANVISGFSNSSISMPACPACTSTEGLYYYVEGWDYEDIIDNAETFGDELATMSKDGVVTIPECRFTNVTNFSEPNYFIDSERNPYMMNSKITLPSAGVEGVISDSENVAKRYFNLQGVEIANPEAGQVVIVKEGNKASKTIVR